MHSDVENWLAARRRLVLGTVVAASIAVRIVYFVQLSRGPCVEEHRWPQWDMEFFDQWARTIAAGDLLTSLPLHPFHSWHASVASTYLSSHPEDPLASRFTSAATNGEREAFERELWDRWYGGTRYHQEPLYAYAVGLIYGVLGPSVRWVFVFQLMLGVGSNVLVVLLARRCFGDLVSAVAGALAVACSPALYYEMILLRTAPLGFVSLAIGLVTSIALERRQRSIWLLDGALIGTGILLQSPLVLMLAGAVALLVEEAKSDRRTLLRSALALAAGLAIPLAPLVARNLTVGASPLSITSVAAVTFICSNAADVRPEIGFMISRFTAPIMGATGGHLVPTIAATIQTHEGAASVARLLLGKLAALSQWYEIPNNTNFYLYRLHAPILRWLPVTFTFVGPLGAVGAALALRERQRARVLYLLAAVGAAPMLVFYVLSRFRAPLLLALIPFAALALVRTGVWLAERKFAKAFAAIFAALLLIGWTSRPLPAGQPVIRIQDHSVTYKIYYAVLATDAEQRADWTRAVATLDDFFRLEPAEIRALSPANPPKTRSEASFGHEYAAIHERLAHALEKAGDAPRAARELERANTLDALSR